MTTRFSKFTCVFLAVASALISPALAAPANNLNNWVGTWTNTDLNTRGIDHLIITRTKDNKLNVQAFGKCAPELCDWGVVKLSIYGNDVEDISSHYGTAIYNDANDASPQTIFPQIILALHLDENTTNTLSLQEFTTFVEPDTRQNYFSTEGFKRISPDSLTNGEIIKKNLSQE